MSTLEITVSSAELLENLSSSKLYAELLNRGDIAVSRIPKKYINAEEDSESFELSADVDEILEDIDNDDIIKYLESEGYEILTGIEDEIFDAGSTHEINQHGINADDWERLKNLLFEKVKSSNAYTVEQKLNEM